MGYSLNQRGLSKGVIRGKDGLKFTEGEFGMACVQHVKTVENKLIC